MTGRKQTLSYTSALCGRVWESERNAADSIMNTLRRLRFPLDLDELTCADGNCMVTALLQQCKRKSILPHLPDQVRNLVSQAITTDTTTSFRRLVRDFAMGDSDQRVVTYRTNYERLDSGTSWTKHWETLVKDREWGDDIFLYCAVYFLNTDIFVISLECDETNLYNHIEGRAAGSHGDGQYMYVGYTGNHYQSLLPINTDALTVSAITSPQKASTSSSQQTVFKHPVPVGFSLGSSPPQTQEDARKKKERERKAAYRERQKAKKANSQPNDQQPSPDAQLSAEELKREKQRKRKAESRARQKAADPEGSRARENQHLQNFRAAQREADPIGMKRDNQ